MNFDADIDWRNVLPPHIVAQRAAQQAATEDRNPPRPRMLSNWPLPEDTPPRVQQRPAPVAQVPSRQRQQPPAEHPLQQRVPQEQSAVISARLVGNSQRALQQAREGQLYAQWGSFSTPERAQQANVLAQREQEVREQNEGIRQQMIQRQTQVQQGQALQRAAHAAAIQSQSDQVRSAMLERSRQASVPIAGRRSTPPAAAQSQTTLANLEAIQRQLEGEERLLMNEALRNNVNLADRTPEPSPQVAAPRPGIAPRPLPTPVIRHPLQPRQAEEAAGQRTITYPEDVGSREWLQRMSDSIAFGEAGRQQLAARGMRLRSGRREAGMPGARDTPRLGGDDGWELADFSYEALLELGSMAVSTGLSKKQLERYKPTLYAKDAHPSTKGDTTDCSICLEAFEEGERVLAIQCQHQFHYQCICQWLARTNKCPVCRFEIVRRDF